MKNITIWFGMKLRIRDDEKIRDIVRDIREGGISFDSPDYLRITSGKKTVYKGYY